MSHVLHTPIQQMLTRRDLFRSLNASVAGLALASLMEGAAEFMAELVSGSVANPGLRVEIKGQETEIETRFVADENKTDVSSWVYNGTLDKPGDLGYWVGYRIVKSYYQHAADKRRAIRDIIGMTDPKEFLASSGWHPGIGLR